MQVRTAASTHAWRPVATVLFAVAFGAGVPVPLFLLYRERLHLAPQALTIAFGLYALGLIPSLFLAGPLSDRLGRRLVVIFFAALSLLTSGEFLLAQHYSAPLFVGRFLQGVSSGAVFSVGTVWLGELASGAAPGINPRRAAAAMSAGFGLGPLTAGLLGQWSGDPFVLPYAVHGVLAAGALAATTLAAAETRPAGLRGAPIRIGVPVRLRPVFVRELVPIGLWVFALPTLAISALPLLVGGHASAPVALAGIVTGVTMVCGSAVQAFGRRLGEKAGPLGLAIGLGGLAIAVAAVRAESRLLILPAGLTLGVTYGLLLGAGLRAVERHSEPHERAALTSSFYALTYIGFGAPLAVTSVSHATGATTALLGVAALVAVTLLVAYVGRRVHARPLDHDRPVSARAGERPAIEPG